MVGTGTRRFLFQPKDIISRNQIVPQAFKNDAGATRDLARNQIIYLIGLVVVIMAILSFLGLR